MKKITLSATLKNALEIAKSGGAVMASDWVRGSGRHISKRAIPDHCEEVFSYLAISMSGKTGEAARRLLKRHPRCQKMIVVSNWRALNRLTKAYREAQAIQEAEAKAERDEREAAEAKRLEEARKIAEQVAPETLSAWASAPIHPAPSDIMAAKLASGLTWSAFERAVA